MRNGRQTRVASTASACKGGTTDVDHVCMRQTGAAVVGLLVILHRQLLNLCAKAVLRRHCTCGG